MYYSVSYIVLIKLLHNNVSTLPTHARQILSEIANMTQLASFGTSDSLRYFNFKWRWYKFQTETLALVIIWTSEVALSI